MQEMTIETALTLIAIFTPLNLYLWFGVGLGTFRLDIEPKIKTEGKYTRPLKNERYGAYIQLAGKRYN
ncbi:TPA: hypothetical protein U1Y29_000278 [Streptococcus suis]|uniref:Phage membrane protein n=5 Tax=Streptococcus suis TaxID=1307 RepID=G7SHS7_STRSU|nr:hypothetical protein [Streptococcus suis]AER20406.1 hypothetical protein SSUD12_2145 [Streptococcus suis D12]AML47601.1 hypothetical protein APQ97_11370 [Streptococcus suis]KPA56204.1 hypothetical protein XK23_08500 [Streptococcus suis]KPA57715.1 hypothetical protein XK24_05800 [Streptococcus suis]MBL1133664.1 hypothetical protein [Streptococcus suis]